MSGDNQPLIAANKLVDMLPSLVTGAAGGISGSNLTILSGSQGVSEMVVGLAAQGFSIFEALRHGEGEVGQDDGQLITAS
jgi:hypothetical protein